MPWWKFWQKREPESAPIVEKVVRNSPGAVSTDVAPAITAQVSGQQTGAPITGIVQNTGADWFGPLNPMAPIAPREVSGRRFDFPVGYNLATTPRPYEAVSFHTLRALADNCDLARLAIETRKDQMARLPWSIQPKTYLDGTQAEGNPDTIQEITSFFQKPDGITPWRTWVRILLEDLFVLDAPTLYPKRTRGGKLLALQPIDGATIARVIDDWAGTPLPPAPAYKQILKGLPAVYYTADELIYAPRNPRAHKAFGFGPIEQILTTVSTAIQRGIFTLQYFTEGNEPEGLIGTPKEWTADQIAKMQGLWDQRMAGNNAERRRMQFVPGEVGKTYVALKQPELSGKFDEWLARVICFAFSISPQAFVSMMNRATAESAHDAALEEGLAPLQTWLKDVVDQVIARHWSDEYEFVWADDREIDPVQQQAVITGYVTDGIWTINEGRDMLGKPPMEGGDKLLLKTGTGYVAVDASPPEPTPGGQPPGSPPPKPGQAPNAPQADAKEAQAAKAAGTFRARKVQKVYWPSPRRPVAPDAGGNAG
jgi:hypothetical protein